MTFLVAAAADAGLPFIAVTFNYRSSIWGFLGGRQVSGSANDNVGLYDQRMVLRWVQDNISGFGGDPQKVTIWGGSSGADDVGFHLTARDTTDGSLRLFRAAILQSGSPVSTTNTHGEGFLEDIYQEIASTTGCVDSDDDSLDCLRTLPFEELNQAFQKDSDPDGVRLFRSSFPTLDGHLIPGFASLRLKASQHAQGSTWISDRVTDWSSFRNYLVVDKKYPAHVVDRLMSHYTARETQPDDLLQPPIKSISSRIDFERIERLSGDLEINAADRLLCERFSLSAGCYTYRFDAPTPSANDPRLGVLHGAEIGPLFQNTAGLGFDQNPFSNQEPGYLKMSRMMGIAWAGFIAELDPNRGLSEFNLSWPLYSLGRKESMIFDSSECRVERESDQRTRALDYINGIQHTLMLR
ncbi:putative carboxylesterase, type B [Microdochium trichocladiopsis]|uniref:Carboxylic ester hydrolase n=1 Tax=Microdochium trichocladiopsis TaxID=1682393 RepID=A0A9P8Y389_9PEZI|nr:putative carboxylesterase, type B [Microdochium trichocladiopsis]KAH7028787.1 putative carboxylesterase, type B [Microdochium trichocladiopsis]